jgi:iron complex transport system ATP-binding protein
MTAVVVARDVSVRRGARVVLAGASIEVAAGEVVALIGPNGAGKSTLLGALAGDVSLAGGDASVAGIASSSRDLLAMARVRAVVRQDTRVVSDLTAAEVVALGRAPHGDGSSPAGVAIGRAALARLDVASAADRLVPRLSGGEQQRVHLARALAQVAGPALLDPAVRLEGALLLDEPASALDLSHAIGVLDLVRELAARGLAVLVVLHDLDHAVRVADRVGVLAGGRVVALGTPADVLRPELLATVFGVRARVVDAPWAVGRPWVGVEGLAAEHSPAGETESGAGC